jgi:hypothetical protein
MKKAFYIGPTVLLSIFLFLGTIHAQPMGPGMMGRGYGMGSGNYGEWNCPDCGRTMGPGMMGRGYRMGPGMMGQGYGYGPGMRGRGYDQRPGMGDPGQSLAPGKMGSDYGPQNRQPLEQKEARLILENHLKATRNPNLKLGELKDTGPTFEAEILTKDDSLVDKIAVDKNTGWMRSVY